MVRGGILNLLEKQQQADRLPRNRKCLYANFKHYFNFSTFFSSPHEPHACVCLLSHSVMSDSFVAPWTVALQSPLSMGLSWQEYWSGSPFPPTGDLPDPGIELLSPVFPALAGRFFTTEPPVRPLT